MDFNFHMGKFDIKIETESQQALFRVVLFVTLSRASIGRRTQMDWKLITQSPIFISIYLILFFLMGNDYMTHKDIKRQR